MVLDQLLVGGLLVVVEVVEILDILLVLLELVVLVQEVVDLMLVVAMERTHLQKELVVMDFTQPEVVEVVLVFLVVMVVAVVQESL
jgi:hypothetical protein